MKNRLLTSQSIALIILFMLGSSAVLVPSLKIIGRDGWLSSLLATLLAVVMMLVAIKLAELFPHQTVIRIKALGTVMGKLVGLLYVLYFIYGGSLILKVFANFIVEAVLPETPVEFLILCLALLSSYAAYSGLQVMGRTAEFLIIILAIATVIFAGVILSQMHPEFLLPVFEHGLQPLLLGTLIDFVSPYGEIILFMMVLPYQDNLKKEKWVYLLAVLVGGLHLTVRPLFTVGVLGEGLAVVTSYPLFDVIENSPFQGIEVLFVLLYMLTGFIKLALYFWAGSMSIAQLINLRTYKPMVMPLALLLTVLSFIVFENNAEQLYVFLKIWPFFAAIFQLILPLLLLGFGLLQRQLNQTG